MIESLQLSNTQSATHVSNASVSSTNHGLRVQAQAGRDVMTVIGGITAGGALRIGGGDTHRSFTAYNQFKNQNMSKYHSGLGNSSGNIQSIRAKISKVIKSIHHL